MTEHANDSASNRLAKQYSDEAQAYHDYWSPVLMPMAAALVDSLSATDVHRILDLGAGTGTVLPVIRNKHPRATIVGVDKAEGMIALADAEWPLAVMDATHLGIQRHAFDMALMVFVLFHLPDPIAGLTEARNALRPGGTLALTTWADDIDAPAVHIWDEELQSHGAISAESLQRLAQHDLMDSAEKVVSLLESAGFTSVEAEERDFVYEMQVNDFIKLRTSVGGNKQRFESLDEATQRQFLEKTRSRLREESKPHVRLQMKVILTSAQSPMTRS